MNNGYVAAKAWFQHKALWAKSHNIAPVSFIVLYIFSTALSVAGTVLMGHALIFNPKITWLTSIVMKSVGMTMPGLYVILKGRNFRPRTKPIIALVIVVSVAFFSSGLLLRLKAWLISLFT